MQIPILSGVSSDASADVVATLPRNLYPTIKQSGVSNQYLMQAEGLTFLADTVGLGRGGIVWRDKLYMVFADTLYLVNPDGLQSMIGKVGNDGTNVCLDYSFDYLSIVSGGSVYLYNQIELKKISDEDLGGEIHSVIYVDGYFMYADSKSVLVSDLSDSFSINPLKYIGSEEDPDDIQCVIKVHNEPVIVNASSVVTLRNVGTSPFPFEKIRGSFVSKGSIGRRSCLSFMDTTIMVGGGRNEQVSVWACSNGSYTKLSTKAVDKILNSYEKDSLQGVFLESRTFDDRQLVYIHLPDRCLVYDAIASTTAQTLIWFSLDSGTGGYEKYRARYFNFCYGKWIFSDTTTFKLGVTDNLKSTHFASEISWEVVTPIIYNNSKSAIVHALELVNFNGSLPHFALGGVWTSYSNSGRTWSQEVICSLKVIGDNPSRIKWHQNGVINHLRMQKFRGLSSTFITIFAIDITLEDLNVGF